MKSDYSFLPLMTKDTLHLVNRGEVFYFKGLETVWCDCDDLSTGKILVKVGKQWEEYCILIKNNNAHGVRDALVNSVKWDKFVLKIRQKGGVF